MGETRGTSGNPARRGMAMDRGAACACVGAGLLLAWLFALLCFEGIIRNHPELPETNRHDPFFLAATFSIAVCGVAVWLAPAALRTARRAASSRVVGPAVGAGLIAVTLVMGFVEPLGVAWCAGLGAAAGAGVFLLVFGWFGYFSACDLRSVGYLFFCMILVTFVGLWALFMMNVLVNRPAMVGMSCTMLVVSCILFAVVRAGAAHGEEGLPGFGDDDAEACAGVAGAGGAAGGIGRVVAKTAVFALSASFASMFVWIYNIKVYEDVFLEAIVHAGLVPWTYAASGAVVAAVFLFMWLASRRSGFVMVTFHRILLLAIVLSVSMALGGAAWFFGAYTLSHLAFFLSQMGVWVVLIRAAYLFDCSPMRHIALILGAQYLGDALAFALFLAVPLELWAGPDGRMALVALLGLICVVFLFVFTEADVKMVDRVWAAAPRDAVLEACGKLCDRCGLTKREAEVLVLLARGKNAVAVQDELGLSYSTVKTHKQSIYAKLGVHSQQELLLLVEGVAGGAR